MYVRKDMNFYTREVFDKLGGNNIPKPYLSGYDNFQPTTKDYLKIKEKSQNVYSENFIHDLATAYTLNNTIYADEIIVHVPLGCKKFANLFFGDKMIVED